jgi:LemA protein
MVFIYILIGLVVLIILYAVGVFNSLIRLKNRTDEAWSDIDVQLKRRHDLIPNLVEAVKGYASHERQAFENVTNARAKAISAQGIAEKAKAENSLSNTLKTLFAVAEAYPDLKASTNFLELQRELSDTENKVQASRRFYNGNVRDFNIRIESFPSRIVAGMLKFGKREFFEIEELAEREVPEVKF